ncbi:hypothetical protein LTR86_002156 [Recurvomyces mirabilis]|nr:hypothetical protein LTR86_002156 [Recurvomyces mirabilis]
MTHPQVSLLDLPKELRLIIYDFLFEDTLSEDWLPLPLHPRDWSQENRFLFRYSDLLLVCKTFASEVSSHFLSYSADKRPICFSSIVELYDFCERVRLGAPTPLDRTSFTLRTRPWDTGRKCGRRAQYKAASIASRFMTMQAGLPGTCSKLCFGLRGYTGAQDWQSTREMVCMLEMKPRHLVEVTMHEITLPVTDSTLRVMYCSVTQNSWPHVWLEMTGQFKELDWSKFDDIDSARDIEERANVKSQGSQEGVAL